MTLIIYYISNVSVPFIQAAATFIDKTFELDTPYVLHSNLINHIGSDSGPSSPDLSSYLDNLIELVRQALEYLDKLLGDYSVMGRAKLKALYDYVIKLFEDLIKMCPDWMSVPFAVTIALMLALIVSLLLSHAPGIIRGREALKLEWELRLLRWKESQRLKQSRRSEQEKRLRQALKNLLYVDKTWADGGQVPSRYIPGSSSRRSINISVELLKYELMR